MSKKKRYSIGLDIGVASVGWTCMTPEFRMPKHNGRFAMGVREFESAETAEGKRIQRGTRRRYNRRIKRIQLLQQTVSPLFKNDSDFIMKSDEKEKHFWRNSNHFENNSLSEILNSLDLNKRKYPTIYHLRNDLLTKNEKFHPRLIYLALHNLVKFRGHFLNENITWRDNESAASLESLLKDYLEELTNFGYEKKDLTESDLKQLINMLKDIHLTKSDKRKAIIGKTGKNLTEPITLILGLKGNVAKLFFDSVHYENYKEEELKITFSDEEISEVLDKLTEEERLLVEKANFIYQTILLNDLLGEAYCVAEAKVRDYDQFGNDLKILQELYNEYFGEKDYRDMFITSRENQRKYNETRDVKLLSEFDKFLKAKKSHEERFYKNLAKKLKDLQKKAPTTANKDDIVDNVQRRLENQQFLNKLKTKENSAIPHQNNIYEAERILKNQQKFYSEITNGMIEKVKEIISFRIPYYIGPLIKENEDARFGWASRKLEKEHVKPWNFDEVINRSQSAEDFIKSMTGYCAYLTYEKVLPKHSLTYEKFELLNELNGIQIRSTQELPDKNFRLSKEEKKWLIDYVFSKYKTVNHKNLKKELKNPEPELFTAQN